MNHHISSGISSRFARLVGVVLPAFMLVVTPLGTSAQTFNSFLFGGGFSGGRPTSEARAQVSITFDDGWLSQYDAALPLLNTYDVRATFYITTMYFDSAEYPGFMTSDQVRSLSRAGHEIGSHTVTHADLTTLTSRNLSRELLSSKMVLERVIGSRVTSIAYPYGSYNQSVLRTTRLLGYTNGRTVWPGTNTRTTPTFELRSISPTAATPLSEVTAAIDDAVARKEWLIITFHEIADNGREYANTPAFLDAVLAHTKAVNVPVVTVRQGMSNR